MKGFFEELRNRNLYATVAAYVVIAWLLVQVADTVFPIYELPDWLLRALTTVLAAGFPVVLVAAFVLERANARKFPASPDIDLAALPTGPSIAVLPFTDHGVAGSGHDSFAAAMTADIVSGLTQTSSLFVVSSGSLTADESAIVVGEALGVQYVLNGRISRDGNQLRVAAQLTDAASGVQMWSDHYDRDLDAVNVFAVQDDIREQIVATLADLHGVIYSSETQKNVHRPTDSLNAYECLSVALAYDKYLSEDNHRLARDSLEHAVELDPKFDSAWAHLSWLYTDELVWGFNPLENPMQRALEVALKGVKLAPSNYHNRWLLSRVYYFNGEQDRFFAEAERSLALNSSDGTTLGLIGCYMAVAGARERGVALIEKAKLLNPHYPDYYNLFLAAAALLDDDVTGALVHLQRMNSPEWPPALICLAGTYGLVGNGDVARGYLDDLQQLRPDFDLAEANATLGKTFPYASALVDELMRGLERASS